MITELHPVIEAILLAADKPLSVDRIAMVFDEHDGVDNKRIKQTLRELQKSYEGKGYELIQVASGYRFQVRQDYALWVSRLWQEKPPKYSKALLETLSIIAYQQPITRGEIEAIRGVSVSSPIIHTLIDRSWIRSVGHKEVPGRPELFATTKAFLDHFNLRQLSDLPALEELASWDEDSMAPAKQKRPQQQEIEAVTESIH
jgi:segregation and condensation protein B